MEPIKEAKEFYEKRIEIHNREIEELTQFLDTTVMPDIARRAVKNELNYLLDNRRRYELSLKMVNEMEENHE